MKPSSECILDEKNNKQVGTLNLMKDLLINPLSTIVRGDKRKVIQNTKITTQIVKEKESLVIFLQKEYCMLKRKIGWT